MAGILETDFTFRWGHPAGPGVHSGGLETDAVGSRYCGPYQCTIMVDRDQDAGDLPPPGPKPVGLRIFLASFPERITIQDSWSNPNTGIVVFRNLAAIPCTNGSYYAYVFGFPKASGGRWCAEIQDELTPELME